MLTPSSAAVVRATLPVVGANAEAITANFYPRMFDAHPELLNLFNLGNQANGRQRQALAAAVAAYAQHLVDESTTSWRPIFERIAHKHASLGIAPTHYPIVGRHLMAAVGAVLGDAVTPEVAAAWDEVYWLFACELVAREARLYHEVGIDDAAHGWRGWRVVERTDDTDDVVSLVVAPADGRPAGAFRAGQYVSVVVDLDGGRRQIRQYSLCGPPGADTWRISVKRLRATATAPAGMVSTYLHERVAVGDHLVLSAPFGEVASTPGQGPLLLVSAGIGITPAISALEELAARNPHRPVVHVHADRSCAAHPLRQHLPRLVSTLPNLKLDLWYEYGGGDKDVAATGARINAGWVDPDLIPLAPDVDVHLCGPLPFMRLVRAGLLRRGVPAERIGYEVFGPGMLPG